MADPIDFYFDFSSPYGYFAAEKIDALAAQHGRGVNWRPILLGAVFKVNGQQPLANIPLKGDYAAHDMLRCARWFALPFKIPGKFLIGSIAPCRAFYWLHDQDAALAKKFALAIYRAYFVDDQDISALDVTLNAAAGLGIDKAALATALNDGAVKDRVRLEVDAAIARKVFGSPFMMVDGEPFWGADRLDQMARWLEQGPW